MEYKTTNEMAKFWKKKPTEITYFLRKGQIKGAYKEGKNWYIPEDSVPPIDGRKSNFNMSDYNLLPLPIGISNFKEAVSNYYYVDKTLLIKDIIDTLPKVSLFTRPRRFGKTLNMDMLKVFFEKNEEDTSKYFYNKDIWTQGDKYRSHQGKYPVIFLSFKDVKFETYKETEEMLLQLIRQEYLRHKEIIKNGEFSEMEVELFSNITARKASNVELTQSIFILSKMLDEYYKVPPIIIIDEYDTPIQEGYLKGYYDKIISFMRNLFSGAFKDNPHLSFGFLTGILRVAKESIFSGMNNLIENSLLSSRYSTYFGFTLDDVVDMLSYYNMLNKKEEIIDWYDGYKFGETEIFNPWSLICYISENGEARPYWQNTGSNDVIKQIILDSNDDIKEKLQSLLEGKEILINLDTSVIYPEIKNNPQTIFSFLLLAGYLKSNNKVNYDLGISFTHVSIPNKEIRSIFSKEILSSINNEGILSSAINIQRALLNDDENEFNKYLEDYLSKTISYYDSNNENFYHGLMLGLYAAMNNVYIIKSNRESGDGRFDIALIPINKELDGIIVELKVLKKVKDGLEIDEQLKELSKQALKQIENNNYKKELEDIGIEKITKIGIAFYKKQSFVSKK